ncbi:MAG: twin-arginine translocase TatA/TatE family subunit [Dethiobacteria bacterium]|nr:twin-arginine translocase TatA/TatE family subunit [Bacillota bacterium]MDW7729548.1 twin-arginine translocase TatA/TatE family subunit [Bacillota bacterium]
MFGKIGPWEIIAILAVVLLIFGSKKLPELAKAIGKSVVELKEGLKGVSDSDESTTPDSDSKK